MGFTVAMIGNEARPYAQTSEAQLIELGKERGVDVTIKCAAPLPALPRSPRLLAPALLPVAPHFQLPTTALLSLPLSVACPLLRALLPGAASDSFSPCFAAHTLLLRAECRPCAGGWTRS